MCFCFVLTPSLDIPKKDDPKYGPTYLTILEKQTLSTIDLVAENEGRHRDKEKQHKPVSHELPDKLGFFKYKVRGDSVLNICIRASLAGRENAMRFGLRVEEMGEDEAAHDPSKTGGANPVDHHLSFMEHQLERLESEMHAMLSEADTSKERDSVYHMKTDAMHKATLFWPVVHVGILLLTGFTQANHIVQFFKKRHII